MIATLGSRPSAPSMLLLALVLGGLGLAPATASAQGTLVLEGRGGVSVPVGSFTNGPGGGRLAEAPVAGLQFGLLRGRRTYVTVGFAQARFDCTRDGCPSRWVSTQWDAGVRVEFGGGAVVPWVRAGVVSPTVEHVPTVRPEGVVAGTSDRGWGGEAGLGVRVPLSERLSVSPGARFVAVNVGRGGGETLSMRYAVVDLGLVVAF